MTVFNEMQKSGTINSWDPLFTAFGLEKFAEFRAINVWMYNINIQFIDKEDIGALDIVEGRLVILFSSFCSIDYILRSGTRKAEEF